MFIILGLIGSIIMVVLEATSITDIGYWWSIIPLVVGVILQLCLASEGAGCLGAGLEGLADGIGGALS